MDKLNYTNQPAYVKYDIDGERLEQPFRDCGDFYKYRAECADDIFKNRIITIDEENNETFIFTLDKKLSRDIRLHIQGEFEHNIFGLVGPKFTGYTTNLMMINGNNTWQPDPTHWFYTLKYSE